MYRVGEELDLSGMTVTALAPDYTRLLTHYDVSDVDMSTAGAKTVTVSFGGMQASFTIYVEGEDAGSTDTDGDSDKPTDTETDDEGGCGAAVAATSAAGAAVLLTAAAAVLICRNEMRRRTK